MGTRSASFLLTCVLLIAMLIYDFLTHQIATKGRYNRQLLIVLKVLAVYFTLNPNAVDLGSEALASYVSGEAKETVKVFEKTTKNSQKLAVSC